jgi:hypothetical protein
MLRRFLLISLTILISSACSCEGKKQQKTNHVAVSAGQITEENCNLIGENLQAFLTQNAKPLKKWPFKEWGDRIIGKKVSEIPMPKGVHISGDELKEFLSLDQVNHYDSAWNKSRKEWVDALLNSGTEYKYCGTLDVSDSLDCYVYTAENKEELGYRDAFALLVKNGSAIGSVQFACEGYGLGNSIVSNRVSRNTFVMASFAVDMIDENGDSPGGYYSIRINDDGTITRSPALESDFDKPVWNK